jgi:hypothetical protein
LNHNAKDEAAVVMQLLHGAESVVKAFRSMTQSDIDIERDGMSFHSCKEPFSNLVVVRRSSILYFTCFGKMFF